MFQLALQYLAAILLLSTCAGLAQAQGVITIRLSYKVILNPANGNRPTKDDGMQITDNDIDAAVTAMNNLLVPYLRGYRVQRLGPVTNVGGLNDSTGPSQYFGINFVNDSNKDALKTRMETAAHANAAYAWNNNVINIYINQATSGGKCSFPEQGGIIIVGPNAVSLGGTTVGNTQLHEIGHFFNLCHTHGCVSDSDDGLADTLTDSPFWTQNQIASNNALSAKTYNSLSPKEQPQVDDVWLNLMSYHGTTGGSPAAPLPMGVHFQSRLTEGQLDRWADWASAGARLRVCDGVTYFVGPNAGPVSGQSGSPHPTISGVLASAQLADENVRNNPILMFRPGRYKGMGFDPNHTVTIRLTYFIYSAGGATPADQYITASSTSSGQLDTRIALPCLTGAELRFTATDGRPDLNSTPRGSLWSNTVVTTCP